MIFPLETLPPGDPSGGVVYRHPLFPKLWGDQTTCRNFKWGVQQVASELPWVPGCYTMSLPLINSGKPVSIPAYSNSTHNIVINAKLIYIRTNALQFQNINPLKPELNPICYLLALLGAHHFLHVSRTRVKSLTFRRLMSYIYGAPILDVSRSHTTTQHSR